MKDGAGGTDGLNNRSGIWQGPGRGGGEPTVL